MLLSLLFSPYAFASILWVPIQVGGITTVIPFNAGESLYVPAAGDIPTIAAQALVALTVPSPFVAAGEQGVGATSGNFSVSQDGAAGYRVDLIIPPGTAGMQPNLSLNYNARTGNGIVGIGWNLSGLSAISRCPATKIQDGFIDGVDFDSNDRFCLDGHRLIAINGSYGAEGTEYRTEKDGFSKIISYGAQGGGPAHFKVWTKSGQILDYGNTADSRIEAQGQVAVRLWNMNKASDPNGNYQTISYTENTTAGSVYPNAIHYTGNSVTGLSPNAKVEFNYEARNDSRTGYFAGSQITSDKRLNAIKTYVDGVLVKDYRLNYNNEGIAQQTRLTQIQECDGVGGCLAPTTFGWEAAETAMFGEVMAKSAQFRASDLNGDGLADESLYTAADIGAIEMLHYSTYYSPGRVSGYLVSAKDDLNGDGLADFIGVKFSGQVNVSINTGTAFLPKQEWISSAYFSENDTAIGCITGNTSGPLFSLQTPGGFASGAGGGAGFDIFESDDYGDECNGYENYRPDIPRVVDINGDGLPDIMVLHGEHVYVALNTGTSFANTRAWLTTPGRTLAYPEEPNLADVNGDGLPDIVAIQGDHVEVAINTGDAFSAPENWITNFSYVQGFFNGGDYKADIHVVDINNDGLADIVGLKRTGVYISLSTGTSFLPATRWSTQFGYNAGWRIDRHIKQLADVNGDGLPDIVGFGQSGVEVALNTGSAFTTSTRWITAFGYSPNWASKRVIDVNGDGLADVVGTTIYNSTSVALNPNKLKQLSTITDGLGIQTRITYKPLTDNSVYTKGSDASGKDIDIQNAMSVVSSVDVDDAIGGQRSVSYTYNGAKVSRDYGFLGFASQTQTNHIVNIATTTHYSQSEPLTGKVLSTQQVLLGDGNTNDIVIAEKSIHYTTVQTHSGTETVASHAGTTFAYADTVVQQKYELNGTLISTTTISSSNYDNYGNAKSMRTEVTGPNYDGTPETYITQTNSTYANDTTNWRLGQLKTASTTKTRPGNITGTRSSAFEYSPSTGLLTKTTIEPNIPALRLITSLSHDAYGNVTQTTISGGSGASAIVARTAAAEYDSRGQFMTRSSNALGHSVSMTTENHFGQRLSSTDTNGLTTNWSYDSFGRNISEQRADNTQTVIDLQWCNNFNGHTGNTLCPQGGAIATTVRSHGSATVVSYSDALGRTLQTATVGRGGRLIYSDMQYTNRGEVARQSQAYFEGTAEVNKLWHRYDYDALGRVYQETYPNGSTNSVSYNGLSVTNRNGLNQLTERNENILGEVVQVYDADGNDTFYRYDAFGNLAETEDEQGNKIRNSYDIVGNKISQDDPDMGVWTYSYNALGELTSQTDAKGQITTLVYDPLGRMISRSEAEGTSNWEYDTAPYGKGKLHKVTGAAGDENTLSYDNLSRHTSTITHIANNYYTSLTNYDNYSRISGVTYPKSPRYPNGLTVHYRYSSVSSDGVEGLLNSVSNGYDGTVYWQATAENAAGQLTEMRLGNGITTKRDHNEATGLLNSIKSSSPSGNNDIQNLSFNFDVIGNLRVRTDHNQQVASTALNETFSYDSLNRMTRSTVTGQSAINYDYDVLGNLTSKTGVGSYSYGANNAGPHAVTNVVFNGVNTPYSYDENGSMLSGGGRHISYTSFGKPNHITHSISGAEIHFSYGANRSRISREDLTTNSIRYYIGTLFEHEINNYLDTYRYFIKAAGGTVAIETSKGNGEHSVKYLHKDHLGSVTKITDESGLVIESQSYDAHGKRRHSDWRAMAGFANKSQSSDRGFTGHEHLDEVGLIHMNGRVYDPQLGRFISADPFIPSPYNSQSFNRYSYVMNNPLSFSDPSGFFGEGDGFFSSVGTFFSRLGNNISNGWNSFVNTVSSGYSTVINSQLPLSPDFNVGGENRLTLYTPGDNLESYEGLTLDEVDAQSKEYHDKLNREILSLENGYDSVPSVGQIMSYFNFDDLSGVEAANIVTNMLDAYSGYNDPKFGARLRYATLRNLRIKYNNGKVPSIIVKTIRGPSQTITEVWHMRLEINRELANGQHLTTTAPEVFLNNNTPMNGFKGLAGLIGHELGHLTGSYDLPFTKGSKDGLTNTIYWENPGYAARGLSHRRIQYYIGNLFSTSQPKYPAHVLPIRPGNCNGTWCQ